MEIERNESRFTFKERVLNEWDKLTDKKNYQIVAQDNLNREGNVVKNYYIIEKSKIKDYFSIDQNLYEVIYTGRVKPYWDIDSTPDVSVDIDVFIHTLQNVFKDIFNIEDLDILICCATGFDPVKQIEKISHHIYILNYTFPTRNHIKYFNRKYLSKLHIDNTVYHEESKFTHFRGLNQSKWKQNRPFKTDRNISIQDTFISIIDGCQHIDFDMETNQANIKTTIRKLHFDYRTDSPVENLILKLASCLSEDRLKDFENFRNFTWIIIHTLQSNEDNGKSLWNSICKEFPNYNETENMAQWDTLKKSYKKRDGKKLGLPCLSRWAKFDNPELYSNLFPSYKIEWSRLTDYTFAKSLVEICLKNNPVVFTGRDKDIKGYLYNGVYWRPLSLNNNEIIKEHFVNLYEFFMIEFEKIKFEFDDLESKHILSNIKSLDSSVRRKSVLDVLKQEYYQVDIKWNTNPYLFTFEDCIFDLETYSFIEPYKEQYINISTGYTYYLDGQDEEYEEETKYIIDFIGSIMETDEEKKFLLTSLSTFMMDGNREEKMYFWLGKGRNGKGTLNELLRNSFGNYYGILDINYWINQSKSENAPNANISNLQYKRLINTDEVGEQDNSKPHQFLSDKFKRITGGDTITARGLYEKTQTEFKMGKCIIQTNIMPVITNIDDPNNISLRERPIIIKFKYSFVEDTELHSDNHYLRKRDSNIKSLFQQPRYIRAFIRLLIKYFLIYKQEGLILPASIKDNLKNFIEDSDKVVAWFKEQIEFTGDKKDVIERDEIYNSFYQFYSQCRVNKTKLFNKIIDLVGKTELSDNGCGIRMIHGVYQLRGYKFSSSDPYLVDGDRP